MNTQNKYIVHAFLIFAAFFLIYFVIERISKPKSGNNAHPGYEANITDTSGKLSAIASAGRSVFLSHCASCHQVFRNSTGPALMNFEERGPWSDRKKVYAWIKNPPAFMQNDTYTQNLRKAYGSLMLAFPDMPKEVIDAICIYIKEETKMKYGPIAGN